MGRRFVSPMAKAMGDPLSIDIRQSSIDNQHAYPRLKSRESIPPAVGTNHTVRHADHLTV